MGRSTLLHVIDNSPLASACLDKDGNILSSNPAFLGLLQNISGSKENLIRLVREADQGALANLLERTSQGEIAAHPLLVELPLTPQENMAASIYIGRFEQGENPLLLVHLIDMTEQKNLEMRFVHSQKMQAVGQLAGGIAHDFNNLLTAMIGFCDLLLMRHPAGDQSFADIMQVKQNANRAANLVRQLLAFSRRQTLQAKMLDLTEVLAELSNLVRRLIGENIELKMVHGRDLGLVKADQGQLEQVLINLAVNARDAMPKGGTLTIQTSHITLDRKRQLSRGLIAPTEEDRVPDGEYVLVEVIDTGTGIPREIIQKVFEPFFSTKEVGSGTGLGLSTVYGIIKQTGGYIFVDSQPGKGTNFNILLPRHLPTDNVAVAETESEAKAASADLTGKGTVLLVEDETPVRIFAARALRNKGYTVLEAENAESGLEVMEEHGKEVELIVTDVIMPGMNGPTMIEQISVKYPNIKVIFISGYAEDVFIDSYGTEREFNFLPKPFTLKQLASKVKEVLQGN